MSKFNWSAIKIEYLTTEITQKDLAEKYGVSISTISKRAMDEKWTKQKKIQKNKIEKNVMKESVKIISSEKIDNIKRISSLAERLIEKLEIAIEQLNMHIITNKKKVKTIEKGNIVKEIIEETESKEIIEAIIDKQGLKQISSALKDIKDIVDDRIDSGDENAHNTLVEAIKKAVSYED